MRLLAQLFVDLLLTNGDNNFGGPLYDKIAFCLGGTSPQERNDLGRA
jgi:hypothetical protein